MGRFSEQTAPDGADFAPKGTRFVKYVTILYPDRGDGNVSVRSVR
jgi:hypothetical protein